MSSVSWDDQRVFLAVLDEGSLSGAARRLKLTQATVRARLESLEAALGTVLFVRSPKGLVATEHARGLAESARAMERASAAFVRAAQTEAGKLPGVVRLTSTEMVGIEVLPPMLMRLRAREPGIVIELEACEPVADLLQQDADIAIRVRKPPKQAGLVAQRVGAVALGLFAHTDYLARRGEPQRLEDLAEHDVIGPDRDHVTLGLMAQLAPDLPRRQLVFRTDSRPVQLAAARAGLGIVMTHKPLGHADPRLKAVLPQANFGALDAWLVAAEDLIKIPRTRFVFDHLAKELREYARASG